jgi:hypothetical protein
MRSTRHHPENHESAQLCDVTTDELIWRSRELGGREATFVSAEP